MDSNLRINFMTRHFLKNEYMKQCSLFRLGSLISLRHSKKFSVKQKKLNVWSLLFASILLHPLSHSLKQSLLLAEISLRKLTNPVILHFLSRHSAYTTCLSISDSSFRSSISVTFSSSSSFCLNFGLHHAVCEIFGPN